MSTFTPEQFISHFAPLNPDYRVINNEEGGGSIYPPTDYVFDYPVTMSFDGDKVSLSCDGDKVKEFGPKATKPTLEKVTKTVVQEIEALQYELSS